MEIESAVRKHLLDQDSITNLVTSRVWKFKLQEPLSGTGKTAIVVRRSGGWASPGMNSQEYPLLVIDCYADDSRPESGAGSTYGDREERAMQLAREVDRVLHQVDREVRQWPESGEGLKVLGSFRGSEPAGPVVSEGVALVRITYDVEVVH